MNLRRASSFLLLGAATALGACASLPGAYKWKEAQAKLQCEYTTGSRMCTAPGDIQLAKDNAPGVNYNHQMPHD